MMARCALLCLVVMAAVRSEDDVAAEKNAEEKPAEDTSAVDPKNSGKKAGRDAKSGHTYPEDSACIILTNENFDKVLVTQGPLFVKFYDPHCGHCKQLMPTWEAVAKEVNPPEGSAPIYPNRIACMDCVTNKAKCDQLPKISGFPKFKIVGINTQNQAQILEYKGVREEKQLMHYAKTVGDIDEQRKIQADSEDTVKIEKRKRWKEAEPFFERAAKKHNKNPTELGMKQLTTKNFDVFYNASVLEDAKPNSHLLIVAHSSNAQDTTWYDAWEELAVRAHKLNSQGFNIVVAHVDCRNNFPRLCFDNPMLNFPERYDIFPIGMLFNKHFPEGDVDQKLNRHKTWQGVATLFHNKNVEEALEKEAADEQEMMDEL